MTNTQKRLNTERVPDVWELEEKHTSYEFLYGTYEDIAYNELLGIDLSSFLNNTITESE